jgi:hypothetical protein
MLKHIAQIYTCLVLQYWPTQINNWNRVTTDAHTHYSSPGLASRHHSLFLSHHLGSPHWKVSRKDVCEYQSKGSVLFLPSLISHPPTHWAALQGPREGQCHVFYGAGSLNGCVEHNLPLPQHLLPM